MKKDFLLMLTVDAPSMVTLDKWKVDGDERERVMENANGGLTKWSEG